MAVFNTYSDSANTAVRAFLTKVGAYYNGGKKFDTSNGKGKLIWETIKKEFNSSCCYCGKQSDQLTMEHLIMINRSEFGLHHPGNVVPCCKQCNKRTKKTDKTPMHWVDHLKVIAGKDYEHRLQIIGGHIKKYQYPKLTENEIKTIKVIAESLYKNIVSEGDKSFELYIALRKEFLD
ncbi:Uncharacterised protein [uncultured archaeon]|nr:Uncharacterised protein [uncultured archaeon]